MNLPTLPLFPDSGSQRPLLIAGPCSAETEEQLLTTAHALAQEGIRLFRAGLWKPRTKPGCFEGVGAAGLPWLARVKRETGMRTATEVATAEHARAAREAGVDLLWIGARTTANPFAVQEIADALAGCDLPILVKNPLSPDLDLWIGALERLSQAGIRRLGAIHRGFSALDHSLYRNPPQWSLPIELHRRLPQLPLLCDPSHIGGRRDRIAALCQQAMDLGFDGLIVEAHCRPDEAWSDREQQVTPEELRHILSRLIIRRTDDASDGLTALRRRIDECDDELLEVLARRMQVAREIGRYKRAHTMPVLQARRYEELLARRTAQAERAGMSAAFMQAVLQAIHEESVRQQMELSDE